MSFLTRGTELKRFRRGTMPKIALVVLLVIPLIYGALYLWAFWAPTENLGSLPVAIVNLDESAKKPGGGTLTAGDDVVKRLEDRKELAWKRLDPDQAATAVADGDVYFSVTIPSDFSRTLAGLQDDPKPGQLEVVYNDNNSFLASTLGQQAMVQLRDAVAATTSETAAAQVLVGLETLSDGTRDAAKAAGTLDAGTGGVAAGSAKLSAGLGELADGTARIVAEAPGLTEGTHKLAIGSAQLRDGSALLAAGAGEAATKSGALGGGVGQLNEGATAVSQGASGLASGTEKLRGGAGELADGAKALSSGAETAANSATTLSGAVSGLADGLTQLSAGAGGLNTAATGVSEGAQQVSGSAEQLSAAAARIVELAGSTPDMTLAGLDAALRDQGSSLQAFAAGASELSAGATSLKTSSAQLAGGAADLDTSAQGAAAGAAKLKTGSAELATGVQSVASGSATLHTNLEALRSNAGTLNDGAQQVASGAGQLSTKLGEAHAGSGQLVSGLSALAANTQMLADNTAALADGAGELDAGAGQLAAGATQLNDGVQEASAKSGELAAGANKVSAGSGKFATKLAAGAAEAPEFGADKSAKIAKTMAAPIHLDETTENEVQGFGGGFAPFFIALASFVGALITWLILRPQPRRPLASNVSGLRSVLVGFGPAALIAVGQVVIMMSVLVFGIGLRPAHWIGMSLFMLLTTLAFLALQQMFIAVLGTAAGRVVSLVLLMLMLSSSGGTYPVETTPKFFQILHPFMPASYVVDGLRQLIGGGIDARFWIALGVMFAVLLGSLAISAVAARRQKIWTIKRLHPELAI